MAELIPITCPNCSASLQIESNRQEAFCTYCGAKFAISNDNEHIVRTIDEAAIAKANADKEIELRRLELEREEKLLAHEKKIKDDKDAVIIGVGSLIFMFLFFIVIVILRRFNMF